MDIIPVIDLLDGAVVRAVRGERDNYRPIVSSLCPGHEPVAVARALLAAARPHGAGRRPGPYRDTLYIADLDAITGRPAQADTLRRLVDALPGVSVWLDAGFPDRATADALLAAVGGDVTPVFGSESLASADALRRAFEAPGILSLDRLDGRVADAAGCWQSPGLWPDRIIAMTLDRVGSGAGPDLDMVASLRARAPAVSVIGAGGIAGPEDLAAARAAGASAWLVASALHDGRLGERGIIDNT